MRALTKLDRALGVLVVTSNNLGSLLIFVMMLAVVADITGRYLLNSPINGTAEMVTIAVVAVLYMQLSYTLRSGRMTRSDAFFTQLVTRHPTVGLALGLVFNAAGMCLAAAIVISAWPKWLTAWHENFYVGVIGVFTFPEWPLLFIIFFGCGLTGLQFLLFMVDDALRLGGMAPPERNGSR